MTVTISDHIRLELVGQQHIQAIFDLVAGNRAYLREWLPWVDHMHSVEFIRNFVNGTSARNKAGTEYAFVIIAEDVLIGRIGVYKINPYNRTGEIGYWLAEAAQGKGLVTTSCKGMIDYCFLELNLNRIEIRCGSGNTRSRKIQERLGFTYEGLIRQGELVHYRFIDLQLYSLLKEDWPGQIVNQTNKKHSVQ